MPDLRTCLDRRRDDAGQPREPSETGRRGSQMSTAINAGAATRRRGPPAQVRPNTSSAAWPGPCPWRRRCRASSCRARWPAPPGARSRASPGPGAELRTGRCRCRRRPLRRRASARPPRAAQGKARQDREEARPECRLSMPIRRAVMRRQALPAPRHSTGSVVSAAAPVALRPGRGGDRRQKRPDAAQRRAQVEGDDHRRNADHDRMGRHPLRTGRRCRPIAHGRLFRSRRCPMRPIRSTTIRAAPKGPSPSRA